MDKKDVASMTIVSLLLAFAFSYSFEGPLTLDNWMSNFLVTLILVVFSLLIYELIQRKVADYYFADLHTRVFGVGTLLTVATMFFSNGLLIFAAPWTIRLKSLFSTSSGRKYAPSTPEYSRIALSGVLASFVLAIVGKLLFPFLGLVAEKLVLINISIAISALIPFITVFPYAISRTKPNSKIGQYAVGDYVFYGSRPLWALSFVFVVAGGLGLWLFDSLYVLLGALVAAIIVWLAWLYHVEGFKPQP